MVNCNAVKLIKYSDHKQEESFDNKGFSMVHTASIASAKRIMCYAFRWQTKESGEA